MWIVSKMPAANITARPALTIAATHCLSNSGIDMQHSLRKPLSWMWTIHS